MPIRLHYSGSFFDSVPSIRGIRLEIQPKSLNLVDVVSYTIAFVALWDFFSLSQHLDC